MAQVVYDQHPLGDYLKDEAGEQVMSMSMPGGDSPVADDSETDRNRDVLEPLIEVLRHLSQSLMQLSRQTAHREFAERFTHAIILSPLLSETNNAPTPPLALPEHSHEERVAPVHAWPVAAAILVAAVFVTSGLTLATVIAAVAGLAHVTKVAPEHHARKFLMIACGKLRAGGWLGDWEDDPAPVTLTALDRCVQAASVWDSVVSEAMTLLETEERNMFYASSPQSPRPSTSALRIAITSEINTATTTTDTLRSLFGPLTSPAALAPLTAMYGPPASPPPVRVRHHARYASISSGPRGDMTPPLTAGNKRSTWGPGGKFSAGASYSNLGLGRRRTSASLRRSRLPTPSLAEDVTVESDIGEESEKLAPLPQFNSDSEAPPRTPPRKLRTPLGSPLAFKTPAPEFDEVSPNLVPTTFGSAALSTLRRASSQIQTTSLSTLRHALDSARASRRHTAAHLLALRFTDGDGEYWEDVRSVLGLLSAGLEDSTSRLSAAVDAMHSADTSFGSERSVSIGASVVTPLSVSFAPSLRPRERFEICVHEMSGAVQRANHLASGVLGLSETEEEAKLESIRRELGSALRQLERARAVLRAQKSLPREEEDSDVPALDASPSSPASSELVSFDRRRDSLNSDKSDPQELESAHVGPDDASSYLLLATSAQSLPPPGIEQVFEADTEEIALATGEMGSLRPKTGLTRAERIEAARARRAAVVDKPVDGNWEVVRELKAVISEVGTRRRRDVPPELDLSRTRGEVEVEAVL